MVIIAHFIDDNEVMRHLVICFMRVVFIHMGKRLAQCVCEALREMNLLEKLWSFITGNASTDLEMMLVLSNPLNEDHPLPLSDN